MRRVALITILGFAIFSCSVISPFPDAVSPTDTAPAPDTVTAPDTDTDADTATDTDTGPATDTATDVLAPWTLPDGYQTPDGTIKITQSGVTVEVNPDDCGLKVSSDINGKSLIVQSNGPLFRLSRAKSQLKANYYIDPYKPAVPMEDLDCEEVVGWKATGKGLSMFMRAEGKEIISCECVIRTATRVDFQLKAVDRPDFQITGLNIKAVPGEDFYGLGEMFDHVAQRGQRRAMQMEVDTSQESGVNDAHFPIPFYISTRGYGLFVESWLPGVFDMAADDSAEIYTAFETQNLDFHIFLREKPMDCLRDYTDITGKPSVPAKWAFGPHLWRNENKDQEQVIDDAKAARENHCPFSVIWIDNPWQVAYNDHKFDPQKFPDPKAMIEDLHELGFRVVVWSTPYIEKAVGDAYTKAKANGYFLEGDPFRKFGDLLDLTNPDAVTLFQGLIRNATGIGVEGFKLDYAEDVVAGIAGTALDFGFSNGLNNKEMHARYQLFYHKTYTPLLPADNGFLLTRSGGFGDQQYTNCVWPGDLDSGFEVRGENNMTGGLPTAVVNGLSVGASGFPFYGSDVGGFKHERPTKQVFIRWTEYAAYGTIMQVGGSGDNHLPWDFTKYGESQFDEETLKTFTKYATMHTKLFPYIYTYAQEAHETGRCVTCPLGLYFPELGRHPDDAFMLGDWILVEPVITKDDERKVILPKGKWLSYDGRIMEGPGTFDEKVALEDIPVFYRAGALVPMLGDDIQTLALADRSIRSFDSDPGILSVFAFPTIGKTVFNLFDKGTTLSMVGKVSDIYFSVRDNTLFKGYLFTINLGLYKSTRELELKVPDMTLMRSMTPGSCKNCYTWDNETATLKVQIGAEDKAFEVNISNIIR